MKAIIRKIPIFLLLVWPYLMFLFAYRPEDEGRIGINIYIYGGVILCLISIINAFFYKGENVPRVLAFWSMLIKLVHIPFQAFMLLGVMVMISGATLPMEASIMSAVYWLIFIINCVFLISSTAYSLKVIWGWKKQGKIRILPALALTVFSFIFVTDILCAIVLYVMAKKRKDYKI